jgi:hypothetical protein
MGREHCNFSNKDADFIRSCQGNKLERFTETNANRGLLGVFKSKHLLRFMMASARLLDKFRA